MRGVGGDLRTHHSHRAVDKGRKLTTRKVNVEEKKKGKGKSLIDIHIKVVGPANPSLSLSKSTNWYSRTYTHTCIHNNQIHKRIHIHKLNIVYN